MLAKASQAGARRALIAKEQGAACPDPRSILAEVLGGGGSAILQMIAVRSEEPEAFLRLGYGRCRREHSVRVSTYPHDSR